MEGVFQKNKKNIRTLCSHTIEKWFMATRYLELDKILSSKYNILSNIEIKSGF